MIFHCSLSESKYPQVSWTLLGIRADINNAEDWIFFTRSVSSKSSSPCMNPFHDCTKKTNYICYNRHFHVPQFFSSQARSSYSSFFFSFFQFCSVVKRHSKVNNLAICERHLWNVLPSQIICVKKRKEKRTYQH